MKKLIMITIIILGGIFGADETSARHGVSGYFYTDLSPHGRWIELDYGVVVWRPTVIRVDWSPYREGRWIWTSDGWYWHSYEPFGYITYHYGRWYFDDYYGWLWYPDYDWAPAWVEWRYDDAYIGWAPLHPYALFSVSVGIYFSTTYYTPYYQWHFVGYNHFYDPYVYNYCVGPKYKYRIYSTSHYRTNYVYRDGRIRNNGVDIDIVRTRTNQNIRTRNIERDVNVGTRDNGRIRDEGNIKTYYRTRNELVNKKVRDVKFERSERKSSLDLTRLGKRNLMERERTTPLENERTTRTMTEDKRDEKITRNNTTNTIKKRNVKPLDSRKRSDNELNRDNTNRNLEKVRDVRQKSKLNTTNKNRVQLKNNTTKENVNINRNNNTRNEVKINRDIKQKKQIKVNRNTQKNNTVKTQRNTNNNNRTKVNRNRGSNNTNRRR